MYLLYRALQAFGFPILLLYFLGRGWRNPGYWSSIPQRLGFLPRTYKQTTAGAIWLHAVSVGEVLACEGLLVKLRAAFAHSPLFVSTGTITGREIAERKLLGLVDGIFYAPVDYVFAVRRVLRTLRPALVLVAETEIWPNLFRESRRTDAAIAIVNARISDRAYPRYLRFRWFFTHVLPQASRVLAQSSEMARRFTALGAPSDRVQNAGNIKYDFEPRPPASDSPVASWLARVRPEKVWIAASTVDEAEDDAVIQAFLRQSSGVALILAPRKPERFDAASRQLEAAGIAHARRSRLTAGTNERVLLLDSIGELGGLFAFADVVFMGGTLAERGGHNILEPALFGKPIIVGPHMENFQAIADEFRAEDAMIEIPTAAALAEAVTRLLQSAGDIGLRAKACAQASRGATGRIVEEARRFYSTPRYLPPQPWYAIRWALAKVWTWGSARRARVEPKHLSLPVISIGNLTMGGTGKTPLVLRLAECLAERGRNPGILTRGYGRESMEECLTLAPRSQVRTEYTGDEAQMFIRRGVAPVGIGTDRCRTGELLIQQFHVDTLLLDDGFQHRKIARDLDVVLIDAMDPFASGVFPLGRLREPLKGLARANLIVITRSDASDAIPAIEREVRRWNPHAPIFRSSVEPKAWVSQATGERYPIERPPFTVAGYFCGLGNPASFRHTLETIGLDAVDCVEFADHHHYRPNELRHLSYQMRSQGADAMVTTEKDMVNLGDVQLVEGLLPIYWLEIGLRIEEEEALLQAIDDRIRVTTRVS